MKLAGALLVPLLPLFVGTTLQVISTSREVDEIRSQTDLARATTGPNGLISVLQDERSYPAAELVGFADDIRVPNPDYPSSRQATDEAITRFRAEVESRGGRVAEVYADALAGLDALGGIRADIDAYTGPRDLGGVPFSEEIFARYSAVIAPFFDANTRLSLVIDDPDLRNGAALIDTTSRQVEVLGQLAARTIIDMIGPGGIDEPDEIDPISRLKARFDANTEELLAAPPPYDAVVQGSFPGELTMRFTVAVGEAATGGSTDLGPVMAALDAPPDQDFTAFRAELVEVLDQRADELNDDAAARLRWYSALATVVLIASVVLTWTVSRSITLPLRSLTRQATDMARERLPAAVMGILGTPLGEDVDVPHVPPVRTRTRDEVADVAEALNTVQDTALDLAIEQAVLRRNIADSFVNLGRRNQNLLGRQLDFITELESNETNPDTLANLFRLDHLATRMRRNAESLLVLAGVEPPRRWAAPVRLTDVIRAALGEVEDYQRVTVRSVEPATVVGSAAADLAHLLAELIENALVFSPPDRNVDIRGRNRADGYSLAVIDAGMGMSPEEIAAANRRLAATESFTVAPSKYLGHYVAGNLAARHGIRVQLSCAPGTGITAAVDLPPDLLTTEPDLRLHDSGRTPAVPLQPAGLPRGAQATVPSHAGPAGFAAQPASPGHSPFADSGWQTLADTSAAPRPAGGRPPGGPAPRPAATAGPRTAGGLARRQPRPSPGGPPERSVPDPAVLEALRQYAGSAATGAVPGGGAGTGGFPGGVPGSGAVGGPRGVGPGRRWGSGQWGSEQRGGSAPPAPDQPAARWGPAASRPPGGALARTGEVPAVPAAGGQPPLGPWQAPPPSGDPGVPPSSGGPSPGRPLQRRVRGAQMPRTQVVRRGSGGERPVSPAPPGRRGGAAAPPEPPSQPPPPRRSRDEVVRSADEVYGFLSSFSAGVQRGLDDLGGDGRGRSGS
ncbi:MAG TPA: nitrate- and nitrite sensing domain-containing protein [Acidimicrobiales bacterium]